MDVMKTKFPNMAIPCLFIFQSFFYILILFKCGISKFFDVLILLISFLTHFCLLVFHHFSDWLSFNSMYHTHIPISLNQSLYSCGQILFPFLALHCFSFNFYDHFYFAFFICDPQMPGRISGHYFFRVLVSVCT